MKPRILQLVDSFDEGGSERQALQLTRRLHESGRYEVRLASLKSEGVLRAEIENLVGEIPSFPLTSFYDRNAIAQLRRFVSHLRASRIDVLQTHDFYTNIFGMTAGFLAGVRVRIASRRETSGMRSSLQQQVQRVAYALAHQIVANSESVRLKLIEEGTSTSRITVIHNGLEIERVAAPANMSREEALEALGIGDTTTACNRFVTIVANMRHDVKDYPTFLRAAQRVSSVVPNVGFLLAGEGALRGSIEHLAAELGLRENTFFLGRCKTLPQLLSVSDVCVLSSKAEGFSNSILEYMAAARPVVATDVGGAKEAILEGETGYLVASGNDQLMAERIVGLLRDAERARSMGDRGRQLVEQKFSPAALLQNTEALYEKLLEKKESPRTARTQLRGEAQPRVQRFTASGSTQSSVSTKLTSEARSDHKVEQPLRILVVAPSFDILGGQAVQAARLVSRLRELPTLDVGFLPINPRLPGLLQKLQAVKYLRTIFTSLVYISTLLLRVPRCDVIHIFSASYFSFVLAPTPAILIAKLFGKRALLNYHSGEAEDHLTRWPSAVSTILLADQVVVPSEYLVRVLKKFGLQARAINNLIELDRFAFRERSPLRPLFLANRNHEKHYGVDQVLRAFGRIQTQIPDAELIVAGDGKERASLETLASELGLCNTKFTGRVEPEEIAGEYQRADVYLNGSEIDNQPLSILEAFACGLAVVTTDAGGIPDMVTDGETGFVVGRGDHETMAHRARLLLENPTLARSIAEAARAECEDYTWAAVRDKWVETYFELGTAHGQAQTAQAKSRRRPNHTRSATGRRQKSRIHKLSRMGFDELLIRGSQSIASLAERWGWSSLTQLPSDQALLKLLDSSSWGQQEHRNTVDVVEHFRARTKPFFFPSFENPDALVAEFRKRWPQAERQIVADADRILEGNFDLLGRRDLSFGEPINWHLEPCAGKTVPLDHWSRIDYLDPEVAGDKKLIWELNRHQHFLKLGQAYWLTKDEKYAEVFVAHLDSWMDANPPKLGINWASSLEIAFRSISWLWAFEFFKGSPSVRSTTFTRALKFLYLNAHHLETYLSTYFSPNTHLTGEALGLFYLGTLLPEFREAERWRDTGTRILVEQLERQVRADGVYFEQSSYYHRYTADFYNHLLILSRANGEEVPAVVAENLKRLVDHLMYLTRPDGTTPFFGDDDGGRLVRLDRRPTNDFRAALSNAAVLFTRADYKFVAGELAEETLWLLGPGGASEFDQIGAEPPSSQSKAFPEGGYYVMRDGWSAHANQLLFDCGPHGANNCGHAHADALAIEVTANGRPLLVDPGTYTYTGSRELRDRFRGSSAHNVLMVDGEPSSVTAGAFAWETSATCVPLSWINERRFDYVEGKHDGYNRLPEPATHTRTILFLKKDYWLIRDGISSSGQHKLGLRFHFPPGSDPQLTKPINSGTRQNGPHSVVEAGDAAGMHLVVFGDGGWSREDGSVSHSYGERADAPVWVFSAEARGATELLTLLLPNAGNANLVLDVREAEAIGGRAFEIACEGHRDLLLLRDPRGSRVETVRIVSDFNWTWMRFSGNSEELPEELLVLDGQRLDLDGKEILKSTKRVSYLLASRIGSGFRLETSEGLLNFTLPIEDLELLFQKNNSHAPVSAAETGRYQDPEV